MLILPLQAFASAAMFGCAFSHQPQRVAAVEHRAEAMDTAMSCHDAAPIDAAPASEPVCKHCATCYLASSVLIPDVRIPPVTSASNGAIPHADVSFAGFIPDGPERPPRPAFA